MKGMNKKHCEHELYEDEKKEHPHIPNKYVKTIAKDHLKYPEYTKKCKK